MVIVGVVELWVLAGIEFDGEQRSDGGDGGVGEEEEEREGKSEMR